MSLKKKYLIQTILFSLIFITILLIGTFFDLNISKFLAGPYLADNAYYSTNIFGRILEYIGSTPIFAFGIFACLIFMHKVYHLDGKKKYLAILFILVSIVVAYKGLSDTVEYIFENHELDHLFEKPLTSILLWLSSISLIILFVFLYRKVDVEKNNKLITFAYVILCVCLFYVSIELIKGPVGRMRFRAMNSVSDFSWFTPWYQVSHAKENFIFENFYIVPKDGFKSFPSGHTFAAGVSYVLICMPYVHEKFNNRKWHILWYIIPITFTGLVALSRIIVGAHFLSDVLIGGTIAYVASEVFKYIFFVRKLKA